jgi:hypothetical protein
MDELENIYVDDYKDYDNDDKIISPFNYLLFMIWANSSDHETTEAVTIWLESTELQFTSSCKIWGFHGGDYEEWCLLGSYKSHTA